MTSLFFRELGLTLLAVAIAGCSGASETTSPTADPVASSPGILISPDPSTSSPPSPSTSASASPIADVFESTRHGYRVEIPAGWVVHEYDGAWASLAEATPGGEVPGEDAVAPPDFGSFLVMNSMAIPAGMTDSEWLSALEAVVGAGQPADCSGTTRSGTFAGEPATILEQTCAGATIVGRNLVHGGRGYYFVTKSPHPDPASKATIERLAASIAFTE